MRWCKAKMIGAPIPPASTKPSVVALRMLISKWLSMCEVARGRTWSKRAYWKAYIFVEPVANLVSIGVSSMRSNSSPISFPSIPMSWMPKAESPARSPGPTTRTKRIAQIKAGTECSKLNKPRTKVASQVCFFQRFLALRRAKGIESTKPRMVP